MVALPLLVPGPQADLPLFVDLPYQSMFRSLYLLGGSQGASIVNLVDPANPLSVLGAPTYEPDCAIVTNTAGFTSPLVTSAYDKCTIIVFQDAYEPPLLAAPTNPQQPQPGNPVSYYYAQWNGGSQFVGVAGDFTYRATNGAANSDASAKVVYPSGAAVSPFYAPPSYYYPGPTVVRPSWWRIMILASNATKAILWYGDEGNLQRTEGTHATMSVAASAAKYGAFGNPGVQARIAMIAETAAPTDQQARDWAGYFRAAMAFRGLRVPIAQKLSVNAFPSARLAVSSS